ncbi:hypothetical protein B0A50_08449 [Salinomyces thailandicus]|uniref:Uncharacterized protein n=1 Tax=Salinomyces thailandicus TaxID=706561 RepID=A0A4V6WJM0_9PEZI|nr:hypothetical protein B0A50_08449 [Salinomyces thailandica]
MATHVDTYRAAQNNENLTAGRGGSPPDGPMEKDWDTGELRSAHRFNSTQPLNPHTGYHLDDTADHEHALRRIRTAGSLSISPELFEKMYLSPQNRVAGELRKTFGNPTPLALAGFLLSLSPLSCILMGWRGSGNNGASNVGVYIGFGGVLMILGSVGEWIIGNTFPFVVFGTFGAFWIAFALTLTPAYNAGGAFPGGATDPQFLASFAFLHVFMGLLCFIYLICALRTNLVFVGIFATLCAGFGCLAGVYWYGAEADAETAEALTVAAGALTFVSDMLGWWIFFAILLASLDFPFQLPVGDLSRFIKGASDKAKEKEKV